MWIDIIVDLFGVLKNVGTKVIYRVSHLHVSNSGAGLHSKRKLEVFFFDHWHSMFSLRKNSESKLQPTSQSGSKPPELTGGNSPELLSPPLQGIADFSRQPSASANSSLEKPSSAKEGTHPGSNLTRIFLLGKFTIATITHTNPYKYPEKILE